MGQKIIAAVLLLAAGVACLCVGVGFAGEALYEALAPFVGSGWAAAIAAVIFLSVPAIGAATLRQKHKHKLGVKTADIPPVSDPMLAFLITMAKERPIIAVLLSLLVGVANVFLKKKTPG